MAMHVFAEHQHQFHGRRHVVDPCPHAARKSLLHRERIVALNVVADTVTLQHHLGGTFQNDAAPDMRSIEMPRHRDFFAFDAGLAERRNGLAHLLIDRGIAFRMAKSLAQHADAQSLCRIDERRHVVAGARCDRSRIPAVMAGDHRQQAGDVFNRRTDRTAMIDGIADRHGARGRDQAPGRLQAVNTAPAGWRTD